MKGNMMRIIALSEKELLAKINPGTFKVFSCVVDQGSPSAEDYKAFQITANNIKALADRGKLTIEESKQENLTGLQYISFISVRRPT
jgi:hypothetical protein